MMKDPHGRRVPRAVSLRIRWFGSGFACVVRNAMFLIDQLIWEGHGVDFNEL